MKVRDATASDVAGMYAYEPSGTVYNLDEDDPELFYVKRLQGNR